MFLDDELLEICNNADYSDPFYFRKIYEDIFQKCEQYLKSKITFDMSDKELKATLDRTFNLWDSFTRKAIKEGGRVALMGEFFQEFSYKKRIMSHKEIAKAYKEM